MIKKYLFSKPFHPPNSEVFVLINVPLHELVALLPVVGVGGLLVVLVGLAHDDLVVAEAEGVAVHGHRVEVDVRVGALGLAGRGAIVVPDGKLCKQERKTSLKQNAVICFMGTILKWDNIR